MRAGWVLASSLTGPAAAAGFSLFFLGVFLLQAAGGASPEQPVAFNHSLHIENGLTCTDCHQGAETRPQATLPEAEICMGCHSEPLTESAEEKRLRELTGQHPLRWIRVTRLPGDVYFSHRRHAQVGAIPCAECHGPMEQLTSPPARPFREFTMDMCLACHRQRTAGTECNDCHR